MRYTEAFLAEDQKKKNLRLGIKKNSSEVILTLVRDTPMTQVTSGSANGP